MRFVRPRTRAGMTRGGSSIGKVGYEAILSVAIGSRVEAKSIATAFAVV